MGEGGDRVEEEVGATVEGRREDEGIAPLWLTCGSFCNSSEGNHWWVNLELMLENVETVPGGNILLLTSKACSRLLHPPPWSLTLYCAPITSVLAS